jgi:hypothetical protein
LLESASKHLNDRCLAGPADAEITNADDLAAERVVPENTVLPQLQSNLDTQLVNFRKSKQERAGQSGKQVTTSFKNYVEHILFDIFSPLPHVGLYCRRGG